MKVIKLIEYCTHWGDEKRMKIIGSKYQGKDNQSKRRVALIWSRERNICKSHFIFYEHLKYIERTNQGQQQR